MTSLPPLSLERYHHCLSVARFSWELAIHHRAQPMQAYLAGLLHDAARELAPDTLLQIAEAHHLPLLETERRFPILLHGPVAAIIAREDLHVTDEEVLSAIAKHTTGSPHMSILDRIIFLADKIEPLRHYEGVENLRKLAFSDLNATLRLAVEEEIAYCAQKNIKTDPRTLALRELLKQS